MNKRGGIFGRRLFWTLLAVALLILVALTTWLIVK